MNKKVSIIIPFYNRVNRLLIAIGSALNQSYKEKEIILIDDCSTESIKEVKEIVEKNENIFLYSNRKRFGPSYARNKGILNANGHYIAFLDSDDEWLSFKLETQINYMKKNNLDFTYTNYLKRDNNSDKLSFIRVNKNYKMPFLAFRCSIATPTVVIKKNLFKTNKLFKTEFEYGEDIICWANLSNKTKLKRFNSFTAIVNISRKSSSNDISKQRKGFININRVLFKGNKLIKYIHRFYLELSLIFKYLRNFFS